MIQFSFLEDVSTQLADIVRKSVILRSSRRVPAEIRRIFCRLTRRADHQLIRKKMHPDSRFKNPVHMLKVSADIAGGIDVYDDAGLFVAFLSECHA